MTAGEALRAATGGPRIWPLSVNAYRALGGLGPIPEKTELLYGQVFHKMSKPPFHIRPYASAGVKECWLVLGPEKQIEVHRQPRDGKYTTNPLHGPGGSVASEGVPGLVIDQSALFAG